MSKASDKKLKESVRAIQASPTFAARSAGKKRTSLSSDLQREIDETTAMLAWLKSYRGQHPMFLDYIRKMKTTPGWVPTHHERSLFINTIRRQAEGKGFGASSDPFVFAQSLDVDDRPSSLEA